MGIAMSSEISDWNSHMACSIPWETSGWYGVYDVKNSPRVTSWKTHDGTKFRYSPAPRNEGWSPNARFAPSSRFASASNSLRFERQATVSRQPFAPIQAHLQTVHRWTQRPSPSAFLLLVQDLVIGQPRDSPPQAIVTNRVALIMFVIEPSRNVGRLYKRRPNNNSLDGRTRTCSNQYFIALEYTRNIADSNTCVSK